MGQQTESLLFEGELTDLICQIVDLWGEGEALDGERIAEIASNLYGYDGDTILDAIIDGLVAGLIKGKFYIP